MKREILRSSVIPTPVNTLSPAQSQGSLAREARRFIVFAGNGLE
jgi:hypothetical protein